MANFSNDALAHGCPVRCKDTAQPAQPVASTAVVVDHRKSESTSTIVGDTQGSSSAPLSDQASTTALSLDSCSEKSEVDFRSIEDILWDEMRFGHRMQPYRAYAHRVRDIPLLDCFLQLTQLTDVTGDSVKLLMRAIKLLRLCDYSIEDICSILAHAAVYFIDAYSVCGKHMDASEVGNVLTTLTFIAHCYTQDETCPLHVWHQHLFRKYCPLKTLNAAVMRLLEIRRYTLRLDPEELSDRYSLLMRAVREQPEPGVSLCKPEDPSQPAESDINAPLFSKMLAHLQYGRAQP